MKRKLIRTVLARLLVFFCTGLVSIWLFQTQTHHDSPIAPQISSSVYPEPVNETDEPQQLYDIFVDDDRLFHHGYEVRKLEEKAKYEYSTEFGGSKTISIDSSYVVVKRNNRMIAKFDGAYHPQGNVTDFGLFDLLGDKSQQLIISLTVPRGGRHWAVSLHPEFRVLFDSHKYGVGREEFYVIDVDKDGISEISLPVTAFYEMQDKMYIGEIPLPEIIFKYDAKQRKYLPANPSFSAYALRGLEGEYSEISDDKERNYLSSRLRILLRYIYVGREEEGWKFFDEHYQLPDKKEMKSRIKAVLKNELVYRYLYRKDIDARN